MNKLKNYQSTFHQYLWEQVLPCVTRQEIVDSLGMPVPTLMAYIYGRSTPPVWVQNLICAKIDEIMEEKKWQ